MITVGLVTHGRPQLFKRALEALASTRADLDYVILINGPDQEASTIAKAFADTHPRTKLFERKETLAPGDARNFLVSQSRQPWVYFADDDAEVSPLIFEEFERSLTQTPRAEVFGGPNLTPEKSSTLQQACGDALGSKLGSFRCADRYRKTERSENCDDTKLILCNLFVKTELARKSPFPADYVCAEENYALAKWKNEGAIFVYDPKLSVTHARRETWSSFASQVCKYGRGRGRLIATGEFRWFHLVPLISLAVALTSAAALAIALTLYVTLLGVESIRYSRKRSALHTAHFAFAIILIHAGYAAGTCIGALIDAPFALLSPKPAAQVN